MSRKWAEMLNTVVFAVLLWPTFRHNGCIKKGNETTSIWIHFKVNLVIGLLS